MKRIEARQNWKEEIKKEATEKRIIEDERVSMKMGCKCEKR